MGMNLSTYIMVGYKMTRQELQDNYPQAYEQILMNEPYGIVVAQSEGADDVVVGRLLHKVSKYDESAATELVFPDAIDVQMDLSRVGIYVPLGWIKYYCYASWG